MARTKQNPLPQKPPQKRKSAAALNESSDSTDSAESAESTGSAVSEEIEQSDESVQNSEGQNSRGQDNSSGQEVEFDFLTVPGFNRPSASGSEEAHSRSNESNSRSNGGATSELNVTNSRSNDGVEGEEEELHSVRDEEQDSEPVEENSVDQTRGRTNRRKPKDRSRKTTRKQAKPKKKRQDRICNELMLCQTTTANLIPKAPFQRLVREIMRAEARTNQEYRFATDALGALQASLESYIVHLFEDTNACAAHRGRITIDVKDVQLIRYLRGVSDVGNH